MMSISFYKMKANDSTFKWQSCNRSNIYPGDIITASLDVPLWAGPQGWCPTGLNAWVTKNDIMFVISRVQYDEETVDDLFVILSSGLMGWTPT